MAPAKIRKLLVANRGEIACRVFQTARELGIATVAVYSDADRESLHVVRADEAVALGGRSPAESYLDIDKVLAAAASSGADAVHPGYGFLSENAAFAAAVEAAGLTFVGPSAEHIKTMGDKVAARRAATDAGVPVLPAAEIDGRNAAEAGAELGYPLLVKAAAGGGGRGMRRVERAEDLEEAIAAAQREAGSAFGDDRVYLEHLVLGPRHVEVQVFGDRHGHVLALGERECSVQRRHQKIIEEAPSASIDETQRQAMCEAAAALTRAIGYLGAGTVEYVVSPDGAFYFLEMNTRLQVEHSVTEAVTSTDLVRWQLEVAAGGALPEQAPEARGHAIECRVYAEDPAGGFLPTGGRVLLAELAGGPGVRVDTAVSDGQEIAVDYDPMIAKVTTWGADREQAAERMRGALQSSCLLGVTTNVPFLIDMIASEEFREARFTTTMVEETYGSWQPSLGEDVTDVAAAAMALVVSRGAGASGPAAARRVDRGPWTTLGGWRLGRGGSS